MHHEFYPNVGSNDYRNVSSFYLAEDLGSGSHNVDIDAYRSTDAGYIRDMKIAVLRLDDWLTTSGMYDYAATEGSEALTQDSWETVETLTFTPDTAGDYLVLGTVQARNPSSINSITFRLNYDSGSEYLPVINSEESNQTYCTAECFGTPELGWMWGGIVNIPASSKTILLEGYQHGSTGMAAEMRRIIAIRIAAMDSAANTDEDASNTSTSSQWVDRSTITFTPPSTEDYLILAGIVTKPDAEADLGCARLNQTAGTGSGVISQHEGKSKDASDPADAFPFYTVEIKELAGISQTFKTQYGYGTDSSGTTYSKGSWIVAIRKPADETTAYKDIPLKVSIESEYIYKDIPLKVSVSTGTYKLEGITKDSTGAALGSCHCFLVKDNGDDTFTYKDYQLSNVSTGAYSFTGLTDNDASYQVIAWKDDSPHVFDVTDWVLQPVAE